jgi:hypothetical protein
MVDEKGVKPVGGVFRDNAGGGSGKGLPLLETEKALETLILAPRLFRGPQAAAQRLDLFLEAPMLLTDGTQVHVVLPEVSRGLLDVGGGLE